MSIPTNRAVVVAGLALGMSAALVPPASADHGPTHTTFEVTGGGLSISQPASRHLGTATTQAASLVATLGTVTVNDTRGVNFGSYTAEVIGTAFATGTGATTYTIPASSVSYAASTITGSGTAVRTPGTPGPIAQSRVAMTASEVIGNNTSVWNPTITIALPADTVAGTYSGTITHSVA